MNENEIIAIVNQVLDGKTEAISVVPSILNKVEVVVSKLCHVTAQEKADFQALGLTFLDYTSAFSMSDSGQFTVYACLMFEIME